MSKRTNHFLNRQITWVMLLLLCLLLSGCSQDIIPDLPSKSTTSVETKDTSDDSEEIQKTVIKETSDSFVGEDQQEEVISSNLETKETEIPQMQTNNKKESLPMNSAEITVSIADSVQEEEPSVMLATEKDCKSVAEQTVHYLNEYRKEHGVNPATVRNDYIPYAEYRSRQLVSHFAHDTKDEREAATAVKAGTYIDPSIYGMDGEPYYSAGVREAIAMAGVAGTVDEVASHLATMIRNSPDHWVYVGGSEYTGIAVGVTYDSGLWYADVAMKN